MNHTEELKRIYEERCKEFLVYFNKYKDEPVTEVTEKEVKINILRDCILKFKEDNPDTHKYVIDYEWIKSIVPEPDNAMHKGLLADFHKYHPSNKEFLKDLTQQEEQEYRADEKKLRDAELDINRKYSAIVSKRITHATLIDEILLITKIAAKDKLDKYFTLTESEYNGKGKWVTSDKDFKKIFEDTLKKLDNDTLQSIVTILRFIELPEK